MTWLNHDVRTSVVIERCPLISFMYSNKLPSPTNVRAQALAVSKVTRRGGRVDPNRLNLTNTRPVHEYTPCMSRRVGARARRRFNGNVRAQSMATDLLVRVRTAHPLPHAMASLLGFAELSDSARASASVRGHDIVWYRGE